MSKEIICFGKKYKSIAELARCFNITDDQLRSRLNSGYSPEEAVTLTREQTQRNSISNFKINQVKLSKEEVIRRMNNAGYSIINYTYKNNLTRMLCNDKEGYRVYMSLAGAERVSKAARFNPSCNEENFIYNLNIYAKKNNMNCEVLDWKRKINMKNGNNIDILCKCNCGNTFWINYGYWKESKTDKCSECLNNKSKYERMVEDYLVELRVEYETQKRFKDCKDKKALPFDFYLPKYNILIEVDGEQHYEECHSRGDFETLRIHDKIKDDYCKNNNIQLLRLPYWEFSKKSTFKKSILHILNI